MSNVWIKNKAVVWVLTFVFLFTSVFNTGTAFAGTTTEEEPAAVTEAVPEEEPVEEFVPVAASNGVPNNTHAID